MHPAAPRIWRRQREAVRGKQPDVACRGRARTGVGQEKLLVLEKRAGHSATHQVVSVSTTAGHETTRAAKTTCWRAIERRCIGWHTTGATRAELMTVYDTPAEVVEVATGVALAAWLKKSRYGTMASGSPV